MIQWNCKKKNSRPFKSSSYVCICMNMYAYVCTFILFKNSNEPRKCPFNIQNVLRSSEFEFSSNSSICEGKNQSSQTRTLEQQCMHCRFCIKNFLELFFCFCVDTKWYYEWYWSLVKSRKLLIYTKKETFLKSWAKKGHARSSRKREFKCFQG